MPNSRPATSAPVTSAPVTPRVQLLGDTLRIGDRFTIAFNRTLRLPDDGQSYALPPGLGHLPLRRVEDYADRVPAQWRERGGFFIPMYQREALWLTLSGVHWKPNAVQVTAGGVNAVTGEVGDGGVLSGTTQNYLVCPPQPWLDGFKNEEGGVRQFIAMPLGMGYTAEGQITGHETTGGLRLRVFEPHAGRFPDEPPAMPRGIMRSMSVACAAPMMEGAAFGAPASLAGAAMGLGGGGRMDQDIYPDPHGVDTWDPASVVTVDIHIVNSAMYAQITGSAPPPSPITAADYARHGLPWFDLYDEHLGDVAVQDSLRGLKSIREMDESHGFHGVEDNSSVTVGPVVTLPVAPKPKG